MILIDPFGWQNSFFMGPGIGKGKKGQFYGCWYFEINAGDTFSWWLNLLILGSVWQKEEIWIKAGHMETRITDHFF
jgi:hypothetical protein